MNGRDWGYMGEGASHMVFGYRGNNPLYVGKVLRVSKTTNANGALLPDPSYVDAFEEFSVFKSESRLQWEDKVNFVDRYMGVLSPWALVRRESQPQFTRSEFVTFVQELALHGGLDNRPAHRVAKGGLSDECRGCLLMDDMTFHSHHQGDGPGFTVEIKPKQGFLDARTGFSVPSERSDCTAGRAHVNVDGMRVICRYCALQFAKEKLGTVRCKSNYCPCDLFSGDLKRIQRALACMMETPQNNLKVFANNGNNGTVKLVYSGPLGGYDGDPGKGRMAVDALVSAVVSSGHDGSPRDTLVDMVAKALYASNVLPVLLSVQQRDKIEVAGGVHMDRLFRQFNRDTPRDTIVSVLGKTLTFAECCAMFVDYMVAATAKDCSIMIRFWSLNGQLKHRIALVDLDPKPAFKCASVWPQRDEEIRNAILSLSSQAQSPKNPKS